MIYLDNAATTFKKPERVYKKFMSIWREMGANAGRGGHRLSLKAAEQIFIAREKISEIFSIKNPENIVFTPNTTTALNMAIKGVLKPYDHAVITTIEHNSVLRPIVKTGCEYTVAEADLKGEITEESIKRAIKKNTKLIVVNHASNVCKSVCDLEKISAAAKKHGCLLLVDAAQSAGVLDINVLKNNIDLLAFAGHKSLLGPMGTGGLYISENVGCDTLIEGGSGGDSLSLTQPDNMPERFTAGTQNTPAIAALAEGVNFVLSHGIKNIFMHENLLLKSFEEKIKNIKNTVVYTKDLEGVNVLSINIKGRDCVEVGEELEKSFNIAVRCGYHCAPLCHRMLGTYDMGGTVRFSFGFFNNLKQVDRAAYAIMKIAEKYVI